MSKIELRPCPFCGGEAQVTYSYDETGGRLYVFGVSCKRCNLLLGHVGNGRIDGFSDPKSAVESWNRRAERTCRDLGGEGGTVFEGYDFGCSECGYACDLPQPSHCPNCGAKVVVG